MVTASIGDEDRIWLVTEGDAATGVIGVTGVTGAAAKMDIVNINRYLISIL